MGPSSQRPYLLRAMHEWMVDNGFTPHLVVDARRDGVHVPPAHVQDGKIVLNVSPAATQSALMSKVSGSTSTNTGVAP